MVMVTGVQILVFGIQRWFSLGIYFRSMEESNTSGFYVGPEIKDDSSVLGLSI